MKGREHLPKVQVQLGRMSPFHDGHREKAERIRKLWGDHLIILGSTNVFVGKPPKDKREQLLMMRTPFTAPQRITMIRAGFREDVEIIELPDRDPDPNNHHVNSSLWLGDIKAIEEERGCRFVFHGGAPEDVAILSTAFETSITLDRATEGKGISATQVRAALAANDTDALQRLLRPEVIPLALDYYNENVKVISQLAA